MIRIERNPAFWLDVASDPAVAQRLGAVPPEYLVQLVSRANVFPFAAQNGGFLISLIDGLGRVAELHTMFKPAAWAPSREVSESAAAMFHQLFDDGTIPIAGTTAVAALQLIVTYQTEDNPRSQPPLSYGFAAVGVLEPSQIGPIKTWVLTRDAWRASKVGRRMCQ